MPDNRFCRQCGHPVKGQREYCRRCKAKIKRSKRSERISDRTFVERG